MLLTPLVLFASSQLGSAAEDPASTQPAPPWGHSRHGAAWDEGPRQKPWRMEGIGEVHFPVTTAVPEVQAWFDQGVALLHSFWPYEAERSFRWCAKLDPDCAMAYWGLARATKGERARDFLARALERLDQCSDREQQYVQLQRAIQDLEDAEQGERTAREEDVRCALDCLVMEHPDDLEARALYWLETQTLEHRDGPRVALDSVLSTILQRDPDHVGALHYRIHNWDGPEGRFAVESCQQLAAIAPQSGHLQHMPGHVLSSVGAWHEAAIAMDRATRVEKAYMERRCVFPEHNWDYVHNLDYLCYLQQQLGMFDAAILGAEQLIAGPTPRPGPQDAMMPNAASLARLAMTRALVAAERWSDILEGTRIGWPEHLPPPERLLRAHAETRAHLGLGDVEAAEQRFEKFHEEVSMMLHPQKQSPEAGERESLPEAAAQSMRVLESELRGLLDAARGEHLSAIAHLTEAAELQAESWVDDPPPVATFGFNTLGDILLDLGAHGLAADAYRRTLETIALDGRALAGLVLAHHALGEEPLASQAMAALAHVWSDADTDHPRWVEARATGVTPAAELASEFRLPMEERTYRATSYDVLGPSLYSPPKAPRLTAVNAKGATVTLSDFIGRNVLVIFYLGDECVHCIEQLQIAEERYAAFDALNTEIVAISKDSIAELSTQQPAYRLQLLSDPTFQNAQRFGSYDDFEEAELHSTFLVDAAGHIHWMNIGGEPFTDFDFLEAEVTRLVEDGAVHRLRTATPPTGITPGASPPPPSQVPTR